MEPCKKAIFSPDAPPSLSNSGGRNRILTNINWWTPCFNMQKSAFPLKEASKQISKWSPGWTLSPNSVIKASSLRTSYCVSWKPVWKGPHLHGDIRAENSFLAFILVDHLWWASHSGFLQPQRVKALPLSATFVERISGWGWGWGGKLCV